MLRYNSSKLLFKGYLKPERRDRSSKRWKLKRKRRVRLHRNSSNSYRMTRNGGKRRRIKKGTMAIRFLLLLLMGKNHL